MALFGLPKPVLEWSVGDIQGVHMGPAARSQSRIGIVSSEGKFVEFAVPGQPDDLLFDREGKLGTQIRSVFG